MDGAHVQQYAFLKPYKSLIRNQWLVLPNYTSNTTREKKPEVVKQTGPPQSGDIVVHLRWGDPGKARICTPSGTCTSTYITTPHSNGLTLFFIIIITYIT
jgi:hypothetical protein